MFNISLTEANVLLQQVNEAINALVLGKRILKIKLSTTSFNREIEYSPTTLKDLRDFRGELLNYIASLQPSLPVFKPFGSIEINFTGGR